MVNLVLTDFRKKERSTRAKVIREVRMRIIRGNLDKQDFISLR